MPLLSHNSQARRRSPTPLELRALVSSSSQSAKPRMLPQARAQAMIRTRTRPLKLLPLKLDRRELPRDAVAEEAPECEVVHAVAHPTTRSLVLLPLILTAMVSKQ